MCEGVRIPIQNINNNNFLRRGKWFMHSQRKPSVPWCVGFSLTKIPSLIQASLSIMEPLGVLIQDGAYCAIGLVLIVSYVLLPLGCKLGLSFLFLQDRLNKCRNEVPFLLATKHTLSSVISTSSVSSAIQTPLQ